MKDDDGRWERQEPKPAMKVNKRKRKAMQCVNSTIAERKNTTRRSEMGVKWRIDALRSREECNADIDAQRKGQENDVPAFGRRRE